LESQGAVTTEKHDGVIYYLANSDRSVEIGSGIEVAPRQAAM